MYKFSLVVLSNLIVLFAYSPVASASEHLQNPWGISTGHVSGIPSVARFNTTIKVPNAHFPWAAVFEIAFAHQTKNGQPEPVEQRQLKVFEEQLKTLLNRNKKGIMVATDSYKGHRKLLCYVAGESIARQMHNELTTMTAYKVRLEVKKDAHWSIWKQIKRRFSHSY